jgi:hypothetical protein
MRIVASLGRSIPRTSSRTCFSGAADLTAP